MDQVNSRDGSTIMLDECTGTVMSECILDKNISIVVFHII